MALMDAPVLARIGMVNFINTAPLYEIWRQRPTNPGWRVIEGPPSMLNRLLFRGELDLGFVSSHEYAVHPDRYRLLADLSISASGPVGSVFLFSRCRPEELDGEPLLLSEQSQTSNSLVRVVLEEFYGVAPRYRTGGGEEEFPAVLAIGDEALRLAAGGRFPVRLDLGRTWHAHTGLPFVFAVWAVREQFCRERPGLVHEIHRELLDCLVQGRRELAAISRRVAPRIPMPAEACYEYLLGIEHDLSPEKQKGLSRYFEYLIRRGEGDPRALPLRFCE